MYDITLKKIVSVVLFVVVVVVDVVVVVAVDVVDNVAVADGGGVRAVLFFVHVVQ